MKLITVGCSMTYGFGLPDIAEDKSGFPNMDLGPSNLAWPSILANKLNLKLVNISLPGASTKWMAQEIVNYPIDPTDIVVFLWTLPGRTCFKDEEGKYYHLVQMEQDFLGFDRHIVHDSKLDSSPYLKMQAKYGSMSDTIEQSMVWMSATNRVIEQYTAHIFNFVYTEIYNENSKKYKVNLLHDFSSLIENNEKVTFDHPGEKAHTLIAERMYSLMENTI